MKRIIASVLAVLPLAIIFTACPTSFEMDANSLKGQTVVYTGYNGHDCDIFTFSADGKSGTWEEKLYTYDYATAAAETSGAYTDKSWYQDGGFTASFTYDPETFDIVVSTSKGYGRSAAAVAADTYYAADYSYQDLDVYYSLDSGTEYTAYSRVTKTKALFTQDNCSLLSLSKESAKNLAAKAFLVSTAIPVLFADGDDWSIEGTVTETYTNGGTTTVETTARTTALSVSSTNLVIEISTVDTETVGTAAATTTTAYTKNEYTVDAVYAVGSTDPDESFSDIWATDRTASFTLTRTKYVSMDYSGSTAPSEPTVSTTSGTAMSGTDGVDYCYVSLVLSSSSMSVTKRDGYIASSSFFAAASRGEY